MPFSDIARSYLSRSVITTFVFALSLSVMSNGSIALAQESPRMNDFYTHAEVRRLLPRELWEPVPPVPEDLNGILLVKALHDEVDRLRNETYRRDESNTDEIKLIDTPEGEVERRLSDHTYHLIEDGWTAIPPRYLDDARQQAKRYAKSYDLLQQVCQRPHLRTSGTNKLDRMSISLTIVSSARFDIVASILEGEPDRGLRRFRDVCELFRRHYESGDPYAVPTAFIVGSILARASDLIPTRFNLTDEQARHWIESIQLARPQWSQLKPARIGSYRMVAAIQLRHALATQNPAVLIARAAQQSDSLEMRDVLELSREGKLTQELHLIQGHSRPFDLTQSLQIVADLWAEQSARETVPYSARSGEITRALQKRLDAWPSGLSLGLGFWRPNEDKKEVEEVTAEQVAAAREQLKQHPNPLGLALLEDLLDHCHFRFEELIQRKAMADMDLALLSACLHLIERREGRLPEKLEAIVQRGWLKELPLDPFGTAYHYSPQSRQIWSNGFDGRDDDAAPAREGALESPATRLIRSIAGDEPEPPPMPERREPGADIVWPVRRLTTIRDAK